MGAYQRTQAEATEEIGLNVHSVGVVLASLPNYNPGMIAVNRAAQSTLEKLFSEVRLFETVSRYRPQNDASPAELLGKIDNLLECEKIVFWGDWLHMLSYIEGLAKEASRTRQPTGRTSIDSIMRHLFLTEESETLLERVAIVGTTLVLDSPHDRIHPSYGAHLRRLYAHAGLVQLRDVVSAEIAERWRSKGDSCTALDAAFLYQPRVDDAPSRTAKAKGVGYFFGRSSRSELVLSQRFATAVAATIAEPISWIPWFGSRTEIPLGPTRQLAAQVVANRLRRTERARQGATNSPPLDLDQLIGLVESKQLVMTDTYHLAVIAWSRGVPCILFGSASTSRGHRENSGRRFGGLDKRMVLYATLDAMPYYVPFEDILRPSDFRGRHDYLTREVLNCPELLGYVVSNIDRRKAALSSNLQAWAAAS